MNNLILIIGDNEEKIDFNLTKVLKKINHTQDSIINYDLNIAKFNDILDEASMPSLFSDTKVIIGTNFDITKLSSDEITYLEKYLNNINKNVYIILQAKTFDARLKISKLIKEYFNIIDISKTDNQEEQFAYVKEYLKEHKKTINDYDIEYFLSKTGSDIHNINSELDKLIIYKENASSIEHSDIELLIQDNIDNVIYEFTNAFLENDLDTITKMYNNFKIENISYDYLITSLNNVLRQALIIKLLHNNGNSTLEISKKIGKKEFYVKKMLERIYKYSIDDLTKYITKLLTIDINNKSGNANIDELELFLIDKDK